MLVAMYCMCYKYCRSTFLAVAVAIFTVAKTAKVNSTDNCNQYDQPFSFECPSGYALDQISGQHDNHYEDRIYCYGCEKISESYSDCYQTGFVNDWDEPVVTVCRSNKYYIAGVDSTHDNHYEDRKFNYKCCASDHFCTNNSKMVGPVNNWDGAMDYKVTPGNVIVGAFSEHDDSRE